MNLLVMPDITMSVDDTLELDTIIEESTRSSNPVTNVDSSFEQYGIQTHTHILNPTKPGDYTIKVNGQELSIKVNDTSTIPDSVVALYDATEEPSNGSISAIKDQISSFNLSGNCDVISNGINGLQTYRFDGSESMQVDASVATTEPWVIMAVVNFQEGPDSNQTVYDGGSYLNAELQDDSDRPLDLARGGTQGSNNIGQRNSNPQIVETHYVNGDEVDLYQNGTFEGNTGSLASSSELDGFTMAARGDNTNNMQVDFGEVVIFDGTTDSDLESERQRLSDKWGITI